MLSALGIGGFDEQVYRAFLARPDETVQEIAGAVAAPPSRVRHAVSRLESLGLIRRITHGQYLPVGPQAALTALLNQRRMEAETAFAQARASVDELAEEYRAGRLRTDPSSLVEVISGREAVTRRVYELTMSITTHVWVLDKPPYLEHGDGRPNTNETEAELTTRWIERGVDCRSVYCPEAMARPGRFETVMKLSALGEQSRMLPSLPFKLRIFDLRVALVPLVGDTNDSLAVVHPSGLLDALVELFEAYWAKAQPIAASPPAESGELSGDELVLMRMLQAGLKDQAIARQLGVSARTATRRIARLLERLEADTRFQAGVVAAKRGWL